MTLPEILTNTTVRIECKDSKGVISSGTGFFFALLSDEKTDTDLPVIITNKHVVEGAVEGKLLFTVLDENAPNSKSLFEVKINDFSSFWRLHPDDDVDLCVMPIKPILALARKNKMSIQYSVFNSTTIPTEEQIDEFSALETVIMIGYPDGIWDAKHNKPLLRQGITASHPKYDFNGKREIYLDIAAFPGSSGSPVVLYNPGFYRTENAMAMGPPSALLLGVLYAGPVTTVDGEIILQPIQQQFSVESNVMMNLGVIIKSSRILELENLFDLSD